MATYYVTVKQALNVCEVYFNYYPSATTTSEKVRAMCRAKGFENAQEMKAFAIEVLRNQ